MLSHSLSLLSSRSYGWCSTNPTLNLDFVNDTTLSPAITFTRASTARYFNSAGVLTSAGNNVARFDYNPTTLAARGLLIEEQRTNSIRNNTMQGAVAGTPGTLPTNWTVPNTAGLTTNVSALGTQNGIAYIDVQVTGTTNATSYTLAIEAATQIAALQNQSWTFSSWISLIAGDFTNVSAAFVDIRELNSAGSQLSSGAVSISLPSTVFQRITATRTNTEATTAYVQPRFRFTVINGAAVNFTLRIGLPQLEQGAFATSVIPTSGTALTRNADVASVNTLSPWYNASEGTLFADFARTDGGTSDKWIANLYADANNRFEIVTGTQIRTRSVIAGVVASAGAVSAVTSGKFAAAYKASDYAGVLNGGSVGTNTGIASVITATALGLGNAGYTTAPLNGYLRRIAYYPRRLSNAELQAITA